MLAEWLGGNDVQCNDKGFFFFFPRATFTFLP